MKRIAWIVCFAGQLLSASSFGQNEQNEQAVIEYIKSLPASKIDPRLPDISYEKWLKNIVGNTELKWEIDDCGEGGDRPIEDPVPACVSVYTPKWHCPAVNVSLIVSSEYKDIAPKGDAGFWYGGVTDFGISRSISDLASLEATVKEVDLAAAPHRPAKLPASSLQSMSKEDFFAYVRALDVHRLDPTLRSERFDSWFSRTARWGVQEWIGDTYNSCGSNKLTVRVYSAMIVDPDKLRPPADITFSIGTWERGIEGEPELYISFGDGVTAPHLKTLGELEKKLNEWNASHEAVRQKKSTLIAINKIFPNAKLIRLKIRELGFYEPGDFGVELRPPKWAIQISPEVSVQAAQQIIRICLEYGTKDLAVVLLPHHRNPSINTIYTPSVYIGTSADIVRFHLHPFEDAQIYEGDDIQRLLSPRLTQSGFERFIK